MNKIIKALLLVGVITLIALPIYYYGQLPDIIPNHFGPKGKPNASGSKNSIWIMPTIGVFVFIIKIVLNRYPHKLHYPVKITKENAAIQYQLAKDLIGGITLVVTLILLYITTTIIQTALGHSDGLNAWIMLGLFVLLFIVIGRYMRMVLRYK